MDHVISPNTNNANTVLNANKKTYLGGKSSSVTLARDRRLSKEAKVALLKVDTLSDSTIADIPDSDSEYEFEEIVELCEWYPPDFWRANLSDNDQEKIRLTDVTVDEMTVTMRESKDVKGFFKTKWFLAGIKTSD